MAEVVLDVQGLNTYFKTRTGYMQAVEDITFQLHQGELLGVVGESGCGKSITSLSVMGLEPRNCKVEAAKMRFGEHELTKLSKQERRKLRGKQMSMIFQEPLTSLNPLLTIGFQLTESIRLHQGLKGKEADKVAISMLEQVGIARAAEVLREYPGSLSGGMRQRVMIAIALVNHPSLLVADEPTTALDVTIQAQILRLIRDLIQANGTAVMFITHDLGVIAEIADRVMVMYAGQVVEEASVYELFATPRHPYTKGLIASTIKIDQDDQELQTISGTVPSLANMPEGCRFAPRCPYATEACTAAKVPLDAQGEHKVRCLRWAELEG